MVESFESLMKIMDIHPPKYTWEHLHTEIFAHNFRSFIAFLKPTYWSSSSVLVCTLCRTRTRRNKSTSQTQELAPVITEPKKSPGLQLTGWWPKKAKGQIAVQGGIQEQVKTNVPAWRQAERKNSALLHFSVLSRPSLESMRPTHTGKGHLLCSGHGFKC